MDGPRHIEIQVVADHHGGVIDLLERECSVQRRHQKVIEEAPSVALDPGVRTRMREAAVTAARAIGYRSVGTVEFLLDGDAFYFMEMNTRIQVEHCVTEMITGIDLVQEQIRLATGEPLAHLDRPHTPRGHAIECRINAEDPVTFAPQPGTITALHFPGGFGIRVDSHVYQGYSVSPHYDSMLAKIIAHAPDRVRAIARMRRALGELVHGGGRDRRGRFTCGCWPTPVRPGAIDIQFLERRPDLLAPATTGDGASARHRRGAARGRPAPEAGGSPSRRRAPTAPPDGGRRRDSTRGAAAPDDGDDRGIAAGGEGCRHPRRRPNGVRPHTAPGDRVRLHNLRLHARFARADMAEVVTDLPGSSPAVRTTSPIAAAAAS